MLGSPSPTTTSLYTAPTSASSTSTSRSGGRLRGLSSSLRSYTQTHLHSSLRSERPAQLTRSTSTPTPNSPVAASPIPDHEAERTASAVPAAAAATIQSGEHGWIPTIHGRSGLDRASPHPTSTSTETATLEPSGSAAGMTRSRAATAHGPTPAASQPGPRRQSAADTSSGMDPFTTPAPAANSSSTREVHPTIRFIPHVESRSSRPSLQFPAVSRTLKTSSGIVRVGRYSERDNSSGDQDLVPVGFKSKVVSRRHCELWCTDGQWYIKDVKSSSGTFLNHVRLSSPGVESRPYPVNDGDVVQLGIDFKGGEEVIFRCVKIRIECNRGWQKSLNNFNTSAHKRLFQNAGQNKTRDSDAASVNSSECSICLNPVAPCQALFVAPCSHVWHYKCIRTIIGGRTWPNFLCPNCRFVADLEADVEPPEEDEEEAWEDGLPDEDSEDKPEEEEEAHSLNPTNQLTTPSSLVTDDELAGLMANNTLEPATADAAPVAAPPSPGNITLTVPSTLHPASSAGSLPIPIVQSAAAAATSPTEPLAARSATPTTNAPYSLATGVMTDGLMTPRNDAGPFVFDGSAGRGGSIMTQAVAEVSEPASPESNDGRTPAS